MVNKANNHVGNLEWVTQEENTLRATGIEVRVSNIRTLEELEFRTITAATRHVIDGSQTFAYLVIRSNVDTGRPIRNTYLLQSIRDTSEADVIATLPEEEA
jgi:hypothetical protein